MHHPIYTLKHGNQMWLPFKEVSLSQFHVLLASIFGLGIGIAGLVMGWKGGNSRLPWKLERRGSMRKFHLVAGLQNLGNNCFLNVILQALASCCCFPLFLQSVAEANDAIVMGKAEDLPLTFALFALLKELCFLRDGRQVASPRRVMSAMGIYVSRFNLTTQQDAAEALIHLLSSLREEISECYMPYHGSLKDAFLPIGRISNPKKEGGSEWERWQHHFFGPFDGTLGSKLSCISCSLQLSMNFEFFLCLPISPVIDRSGSIIDGCTLEDCLKQFTACECIENYHCSRCLHVSAAKYLHLTNNENETKIKKLEECTKHDSCDCKNLLLSEGIPWPTTRSHAFKQLSIGQCPPILCIHLQRASATATGELTKLQGHISFPLVLDFFPFTAAAMGLEVSQRDVRMLEKRELPTSQLKYFKMPMLPHLYGLVKKHIHSESSVDNSSNSLVFQSCEAKGESFCCNGDRVCNKSGLKSRYTETSQKHPKEVQFNENPSSKPIKKYIYSLVSVVEHYGRVGGGHFAVYRKVKAIPTEDNDSNDEAMTIDAHWFYVSDAEVLSVSEDAVVAAEASLLFYERFEVDM